MIIAETNVSGCTLTLEQTGADTWGVRWQPGKSFIFADPCWLGPFDETEARRRYTAAAEALTPRPIQPAKAKRQSAPSPLDDSYQRQIDFYRLDIKV